MQRLITDAEEYGPDLAGYDESTVTLLGKKTQKESKRRFCFFSVQCFFKYIINMSVSPCFFLNDFVIILGVNDAILFADQHSRTEATNGWAVGLEIVLIFLAMLQNRV